MLIPLVRSSVQLRAIKRHQQQPCLTNSELLLIDDDDDSYSDAHTRRRLDAHWVMIQFNFVAVSYGIPSVLSLSLSVLSVQLGESKFHMLLYASERRW